MEHARPAITIDELIEDRVTRAVETALAPYLPRVIRVSASEDGKTSASEPLVHTVQEAATALGVSRGLLYELIKAGEFPAIRLGRRLLVPHAAIVSLLDQQEANSVT
jgi:excisionase family DNA binding protein